VHIAQRYSGVCILHSIIGQRAVHQNNTPDPPSRSPSPPRYALELTGVRPERLLASSASSQRVTNSVCNVANSACSHEMLASRAPTRFPACAVSPSSSPHRRHGAASARASFLSASIAVMRACRVRVRQHAAGVQERGGGGKEQQTRGTERQGARRTEQGVRGGGRHASSS